MRIVELEVIKEILGLTDTTYDNHINRLLPFVQEDIIEYLNNEFRDDNTSYSASMILVNADPPTITDTENNQFVLEGFEEGMDIALEGTARNKGIYTIASVAAGTITLAVTDELLDETATDEFGGNTIKLTRIRWPKGLKLYVAQIIWENISRARNKDIKSKSLGPSSVTYMPIGSGGYSEGIIKGLGKYKLAIMS